LAPKPLARDLHHPERLIECRRHGRSKAERELETKRAAKARRDLDRHRIETGDER